MICSNCGRSIPEESAFCQFCGTKIDQVGGVKNSKLTPDPGDYITLNCPRCGGKLTFQPNTDTLVCQFCGAEHLIRQNTEGYFLEAFARYPTCKRNDKVVKVTLKFGGYPIPPYKTSVEYRVPWGCATILWIGFLFFMGVLYYSYPPSLVYIIIGTSIFLSINIWQFTKIKARVNEHNSEVLEVNRRFEETYQKGRKVWDVLYYCDRDGTYFSIDDHHIWSKDEVNKLLPQWSGGNDLSGY